MTADYPRYISELIDQLGLADAIVYFPAQLSDEDLTLCYGAMDILIHPTNAIDENFGYAPVEAMACGTPVLGASYGGLKDTIASGETGFLMPTWITRSGIRMDLIRGLDYAMQLLSDESLWARMSKAAVHRVQETYSHQACAHILRSVVCHAIDERQAGRSRPLSGIESPPHPQRADLLPSIAKPWESYRNAVAYYVSTEGPMPKSQSRLRLAAPLVTTERGGLRLRDPAWPAEFLLDDSDRAIVEHCQTVITVAELERAGNVDRMQIQRLIDIGLLICTD